MNSPMLSLLVFASKARRLSYGTHATMYAIDSGKAKLVCAACDISAKSVKELRFSADKKNIPVIVLEGIDIEMLSKAVGKNCGILAVKDDGFADALLEKQGK